MTLRAEAVALAAAAALLAIWSSDRRPSAERELRAPAPNAYTPQNTVSLPHITIALLFRGQTLGKYKIIAPLGSGGFGTVYLAQDTWIDKKVAIKVPHRQGLDFGELLREPRLLASVSHPNIVADHHRREAGQRLLHRDGVRAGRDARERSSRARARSTSTARSTTPARSATPSTTRTARACIHRDLRPANVLVTENGMLKVADFGTSRFLEIAAHGTTVIGSPPYMAPEQFHGKAVFASDIYSLGVTMYQMLTGILPYDTPAPADLDELMSRRAGLAAAAEEPGDPEGDQRHRDEGDGAGRHRALSARRASCSTTCSRRARRRAAPPRRPPRSRRPASSTRDDAQDIQARLRAREAPAGRFCWHCRKPLHARTDRCPFCGETQ